jgi:hypothetical protein
MKSLEEDPDRYNDKEIIKYIPLNKYLPKDIGTNLKENIKDFEYEKVNYKIKKNKF